MEDGNTLWVSAHVFCQRRKLRGQAPLSRETLTPEREGRKRDSFSPAPPSLNHLPMAATQAGGSGTSGA